MQLNLVKTNRGAPALWESGGGMTRTGSALVIANADGGRARAENTRSFR